MYRAKLWDEDKWNIHSSTYNSSKDEKYHEQKYGTRERSISSDYIKRDEDREKDEKNPSSNFEEHEEQKNEQKDLSEEDIPFKAAKQLFNEQKIKREDRQLRKHTTSIEEAIKKAIEEEKKVLIIDN